MDLWVNIRPTSIHIIGVPGGEEGQKRQKIYLKNNDWKCPYPGEKNRYPGQVTKSPKEDESEEIHTKMYHTQNGKN